MNILVDALPTSISINGKNCKINTDFKVCLRIITAFEDVELTTQEKQLIMLSNLYKETPIDLAVAMKCAATFLNGGVENDGEENNGPRLYSFSKDANLIFAAFKQTHGVNLQVEKLHWFEFLALFMDLGQDTTFCQLVSLRKRVKSGRATKEERQAAREMGDVFAVPDIDDGTLEKREMRRRFDEAVEAARQKRMNG